MMESKGHILCVIYGNDLFGSELGTLHAIVGDCQPSNIMICSTSVLRYLVKILSQATRGWIIKGIRSIMNNPAWASECRDAIRAKTEGYRHTEFSQAWLTAINAS